MEHQPGQQPREEQIARPIIPTGSVRSRLDQTGLASGSNEVVTTEVEPQTAGAAAVSTIHGQQTARPVRFIISRPFCVRRGMTVRMKTVQKRRV